MALALLLLRCAFIVSAQDAAADGLCDAAADPGSCRQEMAELSELRAADDAFPPAPSAEEGLNTTNEISTELTQRKGAHVQAFVILGCMLGPMVFWIGCTIKFAWDGSLPARLALWGLLPEAYAAVSVRAVAALLRLKSHASTPVIVLRSCVTDVGAMELAQAIREHGEKADLQAVELQYNPGLHEAGLRLLAEVASEANSKIEEFDFACNPQLKDCLVPVLAPLLRPKVSKLNALKLADCGLGIEHIRALARGIELTKLKILDLSGNSLASGGEVIAEVCEAPFMEELTLACCNLSVEDIRALADQLPFTSIRTLHLGGNSFGSEGARVLAAVLPQSQVDELGLEGNGIEEDALNDLGLAWSKRPFSRIRLSGNSMSKETVAHFVKTLRTIH